MSLPSKMASTLQQIITRPDRPARMQFTKVEGQAFLTQSLFGPLSIFLVSGHPLHQLSMLLERYECKLLQDNDVHIRNARGLLGYRDVGGTIWSAPQRGQCYDIATNLFTVYHLFDLVSMAPSVAGLDIPGATPLNIIRNPTWTSETVQSFKAWDTVKFWPETLRKSREIVMEPASELGLGRPSQVYSSTPMTLLYSLAWTNNTREYCNIAANFQAAALYLSTLLQADASANALCGIDHQLEIVQQKLGSSIDDRQLVKFLQGPCARHVRVPLQLALFVSPIYLLSTSSLYKKPPSQIDFWRVCMSIGNNKPFLLKEVEQAIWKAVWNISRNADTSKELRALVSSDKWREWEATSDPDNGVLYFRPPMPPSASTSLTSIPLSTLGEPVAEGFAPPSVSLAREIDHYVGPEMTAVASEDTLKTPAIQPSGVSPMAQTGSMDVDIDLNAVPLPSSEIPPKSQAESMDAIPPGAGVEPRAHILTEESTKVPSEEPEPETLKTPPEDPRDIVPAQPSGAGSISQPEAMDVDLDLNAVPLPPSGIPPKIQAESMNAISTRENVEPRADGLTGNSAEVPSGEPAPVERENLNPSPGGPRVVHPTQPSGISPMATECMDVDTDLNAEVPSVEPILVDRADTLVQHAQVSSVTHAKGVTGEDFPSFAMSAGVPTAAEHNEGNHIKSLTELENEEDDELSTEEDDTEEQEKLAKVGEKTPPTRLLRARPGNVKPAVAAQASTPSRPRPKRKSKAAVKPTHEELQEDCDSDDDFIIDVDNPVQFKQARITLSIDDNPPLLSTKTPVIIYDAIGRDYSIQMRAHDKKTFSTLTTLAAVINKLGKPKFLFDKSDSCIRIMDRSTYESETPHSLLNILEKQHVVIVHDRHKSSPQFKHAIRALGSPTTVRTIQDQSLGADTGDLNDRCRKGTLQQLVEAESQENAKILNALDIPTEMKGMKDLRFSSDYVALSATCGDWKTSKSFPAGHSRWALAATGGAFHGWHIDSNGFATYIEPECGAKVWILARAKPGANIRWDDIDMFLSRFFTVDKICSSLFDFEVILLVPGTELVMRPNTLHMVYTPIPSVCHGGHFYSAYTMEDTLTAIIHSFMAGNTVTNTNHVPSRLHLQQMISLCHKALVLDDFETDDPVQAHVPNPLTESGFISLMCLCVYGILMNVLDYTTYRHLDQSADGPMTPEHQAQWDNEDMCGMSYEERKACMYARGQALEIMAWIDNYCCWAPSIRGEKENNTPSGSIADFQVKIIAHYCGMIMEYKKKAVFRQYQGPRGCQVQHVRAQLIGAASGDLNASIQAALKQPIGGKKNLCMERTSGWRLAYKKKPSDFEYNDDLVRLGQSVRDRMYLAYMKRIKKEQQEVGFEPAPKKRRLAH